MTAPTPDLSKLRIDRAVAPIRRRQRRKWIALATFATVIVATGGWYALQPRAQTVQTTPIVTTYPSQQYVVLNATGYVVAQRKAAISSKATGRLEWLGVAEGSRVKQGEVIARIDNRDVVAQAQSAEATVRAARANVQQSEVERQNAKVEYRRNQELVDKNFISKSALDTAKARLDRAQAGVASAQANLNAALANARNAQVSVDYTQIRAPFDGVILSKSANVGDLVTPFSNATDSKGAVVTMADMSTLEVEADVSEASLAKVHVGQPTEIETQTPARKLRNRFKTAFCLCCARCQDLSPITGWTRARGRALRWVSLRREARPMSPLSWPPSLYTNTWPLA
jgi:RND family efflux transporter MFP subunit